MKIFRNSTSWISIDDWYVFLYSVYVLFAQRASTYVFPFQNPSSKAAFHQNIPTVIILIFLLQILCYSYSDLPGDVEIYFRLFQKISTSIRGVEMMDAQVMFRMMIFSSGLQANKQPSIKIVSDTANMTIYWSESILRVF